MNASAPNERPRFYFALPRLIASQLGWNAERTESNWLEANLVGGLEHLIWYAFAADLLLGGLTTWLQIILLLPLAFLVWFCWLIVFYFNSLIIAGLRWCGLIAELPDARAQSILLGIITTAFAFHLVVRGALLSLGGIFWVTAVSLNLLAAAIFVVRDALNPAE